ncbi:MAG: magnesium and cobalt transport protein CorA [Bacteroidetes bacterium]|nr:MAG: magnesium and cobalt transport protein CorA [Bacteroidota bacterium]
MKKEASPLSQTIGLLPGTLLYIGPARSEKARISLIEYDEQHLTEGSPSLDELAAHLQSPTVSWINIDGVHDTETVAKVGELFGLHPLILEDIVNTTQRPKLEEYDNCLYLVLRMITFDEEQKEIETEQISLVLGDGYVLTFQEKTEDVLESVRERLRHARGRIRRRKADYLFYALIDVIVSHYFVVLEAIEAQIDLLEDQLEQDLSREVVQQIQQLKRAIIFLRKSVYPLRDAISRLERLQGAAFIHKKTLLYFRDVQDQITQIIELTETFREVLVNLHDLHLSLNAHRMNEVMKTLTIIATIFIPLTFIAGIYGMNFKYMPELEWPWGYPLVWAIMLLMSMGMLVYFRRKRWI